MRNILSNKDMENITILSCTIGAYMVSKLAHPDPSHIPNHPLGCDAFVDLCNSISDSDYKIDYIHNLANDLNMEENASYLFNSIYDRVMDILLENELEKIESAKRLILDLKTGYPFLQLLKLPKFINDKMVGQFKLDFEDFVNTGFSLNPSIIEEPVLIEFGEIIRSHTQIFREWMTGIEDAKIEEYLNENKEMRKAVDTELFINFLQDKFAKACDMPSEYIYHYFHEATTATEITMKNASILKSIVNNTTCKDYTYSFDTDNSKDSTGITTVILNDGKPVIRGEVNIDNEQQNIIDLEMLNKYTLNENEYNIDEVLYSFLQLLKQPKWTNNRIISHLEDCKKSDYIDEDYKAIWSIVEIKNINPIVLQIKLLYEETEENILKNKKEITNDNIREYTQELANNAGNDICESECIESREKFIKCLNDELFKVYSDIMKNGFIPIN